MHFRDYRLKNYDIKLVLMVVALAIIGVFAVGSAQESVQSRQMVGAIAGAVAMLIISFIDYHLILKLYWLIYFGNIGLLTLVLVMGETANNAQRWLKI